MFMWIYDIPTWSMVLMVSGFFVAVSCLGSLFVRPLLRIFLRKQPGANDLIGYVLGAHGVYFGILLGLLALASYQNFTDSEKLVSDEATKIASLYRDFSALPEPHRQQLGDGLRTYTRYVIDEAWPLQRKGIRPNKGTDIVTGIQRTLMSFEPATKSHEIIFAETLNAFNAFVEARRQRTTAVDTSIPAILWYVVFIGAAVNLLLIWMLDMKVINQMFLGGVVMFYLATMIAFIAAMDYPFRGEVSISPDPYVRTYDTLLTKDLKISASSSPSAP